MPKAINLWIILRKLLWERKKILIFLTIFYISYESGIKTFLKWSINICPKGLVSWTTLTNSKPTVSQRQSLDIPKKPSN